MFSSIHIWLYNIGPFLMMASMAIKSNISFLRARFSPTSFIMSHLRTCARIEAELAPSRITAAVSGTGRGRRRVTMPAPFSSLFSTYCSRQKVRLRFRLVAI